MKKPTIWFEIEEKKAEYKNVLEIINTFYSLGLNDDWVNKGIILTKEQYINLQIELGLMGVMGVIGEPKNFGKPQICGFEIKIIKEIDHG